MVKKYIEEQIKDIYREGKYIHKKNYIVKRLYRERERKILRKETI